MVFIEHRVGNAKAVEIKSDDVVIHSEQDALDIMTQVGYLYNSQKIIIHKVNLSEDFFNLNTGLAGEILQKFSNYRVRLVVVGDFSQYNSKSLKDFMLESNKGNLVKFVADTSMAIKELYQDSRPF